MQQNDKNYEKSTHYKNLTKENTWFCSFEHPNEPNTITLNITNLGKNYLFVHTMKVMKTAGETCLKTVIIILFGDDTHLYD